MTMRELAQLANVSTSTVSKAFNNAEDISAETKEHIFDIAKANGCFGKFHKGKHTKKIIAIICSEIISNYYTNFVEMLQSEIEKRDGIVLISTDHFDQQKQVELIDYYASYLHVDGIIVFGLMSPIKKGYEIPIVSLFSSADSKVDSIHVDFTDAINEVITTLYELGHRNFVFISENHTKAKAVKFENAILKFPNTKISVINSNYRFEKAGKQAVVDNLDKIKECSTIICAYDNIAYGVIKQLKTEGFSVPDDFSVVGMDNLSLSQTMTTELTSIDSSPEEICNCALDLLYKKQQNKYYKVNKKIYINARLVIRNSISKKNKKA